MVIYECLVPFLSHTFHFEAWRGVCGVKNCCDTTFFRFLSTEIREKVVQKYLQFFRVFYDRTWVLGSIFKSYASFFGEEGIEGVKNCCNNTFCTISEHKNTCHCNGKMATLKNGDIIMFEKSSTSSFKRYDIVPFSCIGSQILRS